MNQQAKGSAGIWVAAAAAVFMSTVATADETASRLPRSAEEMYYSLQPAQVEILDEVVSNQLPDLSELARPEDAPAAPGGSVLEDLNGIEVVLDKIISIGKKVWTVVEANKPVVNVRTDASSALPEGVKGWETLQGWRKPVSRVYRVSYTNLLGMKVVDFAFRVLFTPGGNVNGKGLYLANVTVAPAELNVAWGFTFNANAAVPSVTNAGTSASPVGAAELLVSWKVDTALRHMESSRSLYVKGDGSLEDLSRGN